MTGPRDFTFVTGFAFLPRCCGRVIVQMSPTVSIPCFTVVSLLVFLLRRSRPDDFTPVCLSPILLHLSRPTLDTPIRLAGCFYTCLHLPLCLLPALSQIVLHLPPTSFFACLPSCCTDPSLRPAPLTKGCKGGKKASSRESQTFLGSFFANILVNDLHVFD